ncbi:MAG: DUF6335 family protein [Coleofasciculaceae cyanobacterium]
MKKETPKTDEIQASLPKDEQVDLAEAGIVDRNTGLGEVIEEATETMASTATTTGGDLDANQYQAKVVGEESVGGTTPTPDQNVTEQLEKAVGIEGAEKEPVQVKDTLDRRDQQRWELDPKSSEDYQRRRN